MKQIILILVFFCTISFANAQEKFKMPKDKSTPVFAMEFSGGLRMPSRKEDKAAKDWVKKPYLQVFADGRVLNSPNSPKLAAYEFKMNEKQLEDFLTEVVDDLKFYEIETEKIAQAIKATGQHVMIADAPTVNISMELGRGKHSVEVYAPSAAARQFHQIKALKRVAQIEKIGRRLAMITVGGGYEKIEHALKAVNKELKAKGHPAMRLDDLNRCKNKDNTVTINFNQKFYGENGKWRDWVNAKFVFKGDKESVEITSREDRQQKK